MAAFNSKLALGALVVAASTMPAMAADDMAYVGFSGGNFGLVDLATGSFTLLGNSGQTLAGLAVANGSIYATSYHTTETLFRVDASNGSLTSIGGSGGVAVDDFGSTTSGLYMVGTDANLYSINATTGAETKIGATGLSFGSWRSLSTNSSSLYFANGANLYTLSLTTGAATLVGSMGSFQYGALLQENGKLYAGRDAGGLAIDTLNTATGMATAGPSITGTSGSIYGLAPYPVPTSPVPEPATWSLFAVGALLVRLATRRVGR